MSVCVCALDCIAIKTPLAMFCSATSCIIHNAGHSIPWLESQRTWVIPIAEIWSLSLSLCASHFRFWPTISIIIFIKFYRLISCISPSPRERKRDVFLHFDADRFSREEKGEDDEKGGGKKFGWKREGPSFFPVVFLLSLHTPISARVLHISWLEAKPRPFLARIQRGRC